MKVKNVFLHGELFEVICVLPPPSYGVPPHHVYRLRRAIYGLKYSARAGSEYFRTTGLRVGFLENP